MKTSMLCCCLHLFLQRDPHQALSTLAKAPSPSFPMVSSAEGGMNLHGRDSNHTQAAVCIYACRVVIV